MTPMSMADLDWEGVLAIYWPIVIGAPVQGLPASADLGLHG